MAISLTAQTMTNSPPIFIVGTPRSGTTLVARILGRHLDVLAPAPGETHYFQEIWTRRREFGDLSDETKLAQVADRVLNIFGIWDNPDLQKVTDQALTKEALLTRTRELGGGYGALYYAFTSLLAESATKSRYCDDTPKHLFYLHTIFAFFPTARAIGCTRDPRDFLCSYKNYWRVAVDADRIKALYHPVNTSLLWRSSSNSLLQHATDCCQERLMLVKYESLVQQPREQIRRICDFLGLAYTDDLLQVDANNSSFESPSGGIFTTSVGRWRTCLNPEEVWCAQALTRNTMRRLGYTPEGNTPSKIALLRNWLTAPLALIRAIWANARKTGPLTEYIGQRLAPLVRR
jgi:hypothetical protein